MANAEHLRILRKGVKAWNRWRLANRSITPDLIEADLSRLRLVRINLSQARLNRANLQGAILTLGSLEGADLQGADLLGAIVSGVRLQGANLAGANLIETNFNQSSLRAADLSHAVLYETNFANADLSRTKGLELCEHFRPSTIDHRTIAKSDSLPVEFLRGCGLPDFIINNITALKSNVAQTPSCFISYSSQDRDIAERIYGDLQENSVRCWFAPEDMKIGEPIRVTIDRAIHSHDKLLLILSQGSVGSQWVETEVERALERERKEGILILFPIRIDDTIFEVSEGWATYIRNARHIGDFRQWRDSRTYSKSFLRLLRDLGGQAHIPAPAADA